jgi:hypothetical protein
MKLWSISTTIRNPERLRDFLYILKQLEGLPFNNENQIKYQILLIQNRLYKPTEIPQKYYSYFKKIETKIPYKVAEDIFNFQNYKDPPMRGRQSVNPLNKLGFSIARNSSGPIKITNLGKLFLRKDYDISYVFLKSMLKLQFPNLWDTHFSQKEGFNIAPFIATLKFIDEANKNFIEKGLTQTEFSLFIPALINIERFELYLNKLNEYRKCKNKNNFINKFAQWYYQKDNPSEEQINNFFEYGDNIMRYFRLTKYFKVSKSEFGAEWRINLEPTRYAEIDFLINNYSGGSIPFSNEEDYYNYINDIKKPTILLDNKRIIDSIILSLKSDINKFVKDNDINLTKNELGILNKNFEKLQFNVKEKYLNNLRELLVNIRIKSEKISILNNKDELKKISGLLKNNKELRKLSPEEFEKLTSLVLRVFNDEILIKPNYIMDDNGEPIAHAAGNKADIECFYKSFNNICEVTLSQSNTQWIMETQPVMRHLRNFELSYKNNPAYCLFVAPKVHTDTAYHFWMSNKNGYNGTKQKIIPLTTEQLSKILDLLLRLTSYGKRFYHTNIKSLYDSIINSAIKCNGHDKWLNSINEVIYKWEKEILNENE